MLVARLRAQKLLALSRLSPSGIWAALTLLLALCLSSAAKAATTASESAHTQWYAAIAKLVQNSLPVTATQHHFEVLTPADSLAPLEDCDGVTARFTREPERLSGRTMVTVQCGTSGQDNPRFVQIAVNVTGKYLVAARDLAAQQVLSRGDVVIKEGDLGRLPRHAILATPRAIKQVVGQQLRRSLSQHSVIQENLLSRPQVVSYGDQLIISAVGNGFQITRTGEAMDTGAIGDIIRVRLNNKQLIQVEITAPGRAKPAN